MVSSSLGRGCICAIVVYVEFYLCMNSSYDVVAVVSLEVPMAIVWSIKLLVVLGIVTSLLV